MTKESDTPGCKRPQETVSVDHSLLVRNRHLKREESCPKPGVHMQTARLPEHRRVISSDLKKKKNRRKDFSFFQIISSAKLIPPSIQMQ